MFRGRTSSLVFVVVLTGLLSAASGCQTQRWEDAKYRRLEKIDRGVHRYEKYDAEGVERMDRTLAIAERSSCRHQEKLHRTIDLVDREMESDVQRWNEEIPKRRAYIRGQWDTRQDRIPRTWAKMMY